MEVTFKLRSEEANHVKDMIRIGVRRMELSPVVERASVQALGKKDLGMFKKLKARMFGEAAGEAEEGNRQSTGFNFNSKNKKIFCREPLQNFK